MLASLYIQALGPRGTVQTSATGFVLRDTDGAPYVITNRHVVTGQNSLDELNVPGNPPAISVLRVAMHAAGRFGTWLPVALLLGDKDGRPYWLEHPVTGREWTSSRCRWGASWRRTGWTSSRTLMLALPPGWSLAPNSR
jgi:hypothetical protein